jgi:OmpR-family two-component system manganese-sensing response regulator
MQREFLFFFYFFFIIISDMRVLLVEDNTDLCDSLRTYLEAACYIVDYAYDGDRGSYLARTNEYDLIVLDSILPKKSGIKICEEMRKSNKVVPIISITVKSEITDKVELFNAGVDDYICKPFSYEEFLARVRAVLRRPAYIEGHILTVYDVAMDVRHQRVTRNAKPIYLTKKEFTLLEFMLKNKNSVVSRGAIMEHVWNSESDPFSNTIEAHILNLRKKLELPNRRRFIMNVPGRGYMIEEREKSLPRRRIALE